MSKEVRYRSLALITKYFPYNSGDVPAESYLETEIGILSDMFETVYVFSVDAPMDRKLCQKLPSNVKAFPLGIARSNTEKAKLLASSLVPVKKQDRSFFKLVRQSEKKLKVSQALLFRYAFNKAQTYRSAIESVAARNDLHLEGALFYSFWLFDTALAASRLASECGGAAISRAHRYDLYENQNAFGYLPFRQYLGSQLKVIASCSEDGARHLVLRDDFPPEKVRVSYLGTGDLGYADLRIRSQPLVITCSTLTKVKRVPLIADAMSILDNEGFQLRWKHFGAGPEKEKVQARINQFHCIDAKLMGNLGHDDLIRIYRDDPPHLFVNASSSEGLPISVMEACSLGTPVVCTDVGGSSEIVSENNGVLLSADVSARELADAIRLALSSSAGSYRCLRIGSRRIWEERFDAASNIRELFASIAEGREENAC